MTILITGKNAVAGAEADTGNRVFGWGDNEFGMLGTGVDQDYSSPVQLGDLETWFRMRGGRANFTGIKLDGTLWSCGRGTFGVNGNSASADLSSPVQIGSNTFWSKISGGNHHRHLIREDGTLWALGINHRGQLGLGHTTYSLSSPVQVGELDNWASGSAFNYNHSQFIKTDGTLWSCGLNNLGQLGVGNTANYSSPVQVGSLTTWAFVSGGYQTTFAISTTGKLYSWGKGAGGGLGHGNTTNLSSPVQIGARTDWAYVSHSSNGGNTHATTTDFKLFSWGQNERGQLGFGNTVATSSPAQVGALTTWKRPQNSGSGAHAIKTDGTIWSWGYGRKGCTGHGNTTDYSSPVQIGSLTDWAQDTDHCSNSFSMMLFRLPA